MTTVSQYLNQILHVENAWQATFIVFAFGVAAAVHFAWKKQQSERTEAAKGFARVLLRSVERVAWPLTALFILLLGELVFQRFQLPHQAMSVLIPLVAALAGIRFIIYLLRKSLKGGPLLKALESVVGLIIWLVIGLHLLGVLPQTLSTLDSVGLDMGDFRLSLLSGLKMVVMITLALAMAGIITNVIEGRISESTVLNPSTRVGLVKFTKFAVITIAILVALSAAGINMSTFAVFGGALGVGLGFGLQRIAANFISGFIVIFDRSVKPGDNITVGDRFGWVQELRSRYIVLRDRNGVDILIPNENLITNEVINWSYADTNVRLRVDVDISYEDDVEKALEIVKACGAVSDRILQDPPPNALLTEFADSGITIQLRFWIADPQNGRENVSSMVRVAIWKAFKENGITIPFPQRDLHLKSVPEGFRLEDKS
ncbi:MULTISPECIES: mechanosensitive ion channel family protein [Gammaproteobacteria]|uniref:mechanosensitive ion channel family protein n=1 Tax=Gammaproteobacteria TaxID=1236 RepID=UPI000DCFB578|nr:MULTISPECIES: mechanosensitive ion channel domain-containing protein [Gammaproteobacteria]RTE86747.1 mechanosensitive ion channel [Aliidiomarina sp. B3213]TCZ90699.1 mechanosensitive ion channel [Lysobacter sp. N42]